MSKTTLTPIELFTKKYIVSVEQFFNGSPCWIWQAKLNHHGYGTFWIKSKQTMTGAHRFAYEHYMGPIPSDLQIDHLCRVRNCVNPAHMETVTGKVNCLRGDSPSAQCARKTHCIRGHPFTKDNTRPRPDGGRHCRECRRMHKRESYRRKHPEAYHRVS